MLTISPYAKIVARWLVLIAATVLVMRSQAAKAEEAVYTAVTQDGGPAVWIVNTITGTVKICWPVGSFPAYEVLCSEEEN